MALPDNLPQSANIQGFWRFEDNFNDSSGNGYTLTETSGTIPFSASGKINKAADFEAGDTEYLAIAHASCTNLRFTGNFTIAAWIKPESVSTSNNAIVAKWNGTTVNRRCYMLRTYDKKPTLIVSSEGATSTNISGSTTINAATWYHVCGVYDGSYLRLYLNGSSNADAVSYSSGIADKDTPFIIGCFLNNNSPEGYFDGLIDEVIVWNTALTAEEVDSVYDITSYRYDKSLSGSLVLAGAITKAVKKAIAGAPDFNGEITTAYTAGAIEYEKAVGGELTLAGNITKNILKPIAGTLTLAGVINKRIAKSFTGVLNITGAISKKIAKSVTGTVVAVGTLNKKLSRNISGAIEFANEANKKIAISVSGSAVFTGTVSGIKKVTSAASGVVQTTGEIGRKISKRLNGSFTAAGSISKRILKTSVAAGNLTILGTLGLKIKKAFTAVVQFAGTLIASIVTGSTIKTASLVYDSGNLIKISGDVDAGTYPMCNNAVTLLVSGAGYTFNPLSRTPNGDCNGYLDYVNNSTFTVKFST